VGNYAAAMTTLLAVLMEVSEMALDLPVGLFAPFFAGAPNFIRLAYYAPKDERGGGGSGGGSGSGESGAAVDAVSACGNTNVADASVGAGAGSDADAGGEAMRYGAHTDYQGFTILSQDAPGLQVQMDNTNLPSNSTSTSTASTASTSTDTKDSNCRWVDIPPVEGAFIINAGDLLQHWTNGVWISNVHRVVNRPGVGERLSL
jgi:isopenicillin N synthase-like dioxygenase